MQPHDNSLAERSRRLPLLWLCALLLTGLWLGQQRRLDWTAWLSACAALAFLAVWERAAGRRSSLLKRLKTFLPLPLALLGCAFLAGLWRGQSSIPVWSPARLEWYSGGGEVRVSGRVSDLPRSPGAVSILQLEARQVQELDGNGLARTARRVSGSLQVVLPAGFEPRVGDLLVLQGELSEPEESSAYRPVVSRMEYPSVETAGVEYRADSLVAAVRLRLADLIRRLLPQPEAGLLEGILLGMEGDISYDLKEAFRATGTSHIVAISGFNIAMVAGLFSLLSGMFFGRGSAWLVTLAGVGLYALLAGGSPPVVRAALMCGMALAGASLGRRSSGLTPLAFSAACMACISPAVLFETGFQLSFSATLGLVWFAAPLQDGLRRRLERLLPREAARRLAQPIGEYFLVTLAAQAATLPVILHHFQRLSPVSLLANPLILPPQPLVMLLGGLAVLAGLVWLPAGQALGWAAWVPLAYTTRLVEWLAGLGQNLRLPEFPAWAVVLCFALLALAALGRSLPRPAVTPLAHSVALTCLGLGAVLAWRLAAERLDGSLRLQFLALGDNPPVLLRDPGGCLTLVGGSADSSALESAAGRLLPPFSTRLDLALLGGLNARSAAGLQSMFRQSPPRLAALPPQAQPGAKWLRQMRAALHQEGVSVDEVSAGQSLQLCGGAGLKIEEAGVLRLSWQKLDALLWLEAPPLRPAAVCPNLLALNAKSLPGLAPLRQSGCAPRLVVWLGTDLPQELHGLPSITLEGRRALTLVSDGRQVWAQSR